MASLARVHFLAGVRTYLNITMLKMRLCLGMKAVLLPQQNILCGLKGTDNHYSYIKRKRDIGINVSVSFIVVE
jgi:hypothetical protein